MPIEQDFTPAASPARAQRRDRGPRLFVTLVTLAMVGVVAYGLLAGNNGFIKSVIKALNATPAPSASPDSSASPTATP
jgi:hypothetical protein